MLGALEKMSSEKKMTEKRCDKNLLAHVSAEENKNNKRGRSSSTNKSMKMNEGDINPNVLTGVELSELSLTKNIGEFYHWIEQAEKYSRIMLVNTKPKWIQIQLLLKY